MGKSYGHFKREEVLRILQLRQKGWSYRRIGEVLSRGGNAGGSIKRFLERNKHPLPWMAKAFDVYEHARDMYERSLKKREIPRKKAKLASNDKLKSRVIDLLVSEQASPRDISIRIKEEPTDVRIGRTAIYEFIKRERPDLKEHLRLRGKVRKQRVVRRGSHFKTGAPEKRRIDERPVWVWDRSEYGHYEADTIHSHRGGSGCAILTVREMKSRMRWYFIVVDLKAETTLAVLQGFLRMMPAHMRKTLTVDNGPENALLYKLETVFSGFKVYYCHPYSAWERGAVENANGELRWYFPKGTDFKNIPYRDLRDTQDKLNRRRMQCLGGKSAAMMFQEALENPPLIQIAPTSVLSSAAAIYEAAASLRFEQKSGLYLPSPAQLS